MTTSSTSSLLLATSMTSNLPPATSTTTNLPPATSTTSNLPPATSFTSQLPPATSTTSNLPPTTSLTSQLPPATSLTSHLPPATSLTSHLLLSISTARACNINEADLFVVPVIGEEILLIEAEIEEVDDVTMNEDVEGNVNLKPESAQMAKSSSNSENEACCSKACKKNTDSLNAKITELSEKLSDSKTMSYHYKLGLSQVEARLVEFKNQEIKFCEKIRGLEFKVESKDNIIERLTKDLGELKKEKEGLDSKLTGFQSASKDLDTLIGSQRPSPSIESNSSDLQNSNSSVSKHEESSESIMSKPMIKFVKAADCVDVKTNKVEAAKKPSVKYAEMYRNTHKSPKVEKRKSWPKNNYTHKSMSPRTVFRNTGRTSSVNRPNMNVAQPKRTSFAKPAHSYVRRPFHGRSAVRTQSQVPRVSTVTKRFPTVESKFSTVKSTFFADWGNKGKAVKASACWIWRLIQNTTKKCPNCNSVSVIFKKYQYIDTQGRLKSVMAWVPKKV
uniref:Uncharacterized protein n=1 Tax=Tanacetum cinerariifolium TaxID=118510 RepID=A0A6L2KNM8_TANCI|nr:hypothetical protein [Tanacetum cinerariifolium]